MRVLRRSAAPLALLAVGVAAYLVVRPTHSQPPAAAEPGVAWHGLAGGARAAIPVTERAIVVLNTPSVAQRLAQAHYATEAQERSWVSQASAAQTQVVTTLAADGITVTPDFTYERVLDGFSAVLDPRAVALLEQLPEVQGVYPVRAAFPAALSRGALPAGELGSAGGHWPAAALPGYDGHGVTIALLDTGVDRAQPYLSGKVLAGFDIVGGGVDAAPRTNPLDRSQVERHGTELAGILVGSRGPEGLHGVAPGATLLPIRVAGWQPTAAGGELVYARTDQLLAGLERAVDPNGDGDEHDAVRVAVLGVAEPYAAFTDGPEAQAVQGALELGTLVVAPAGNDGRVGPSFGSIAGPAGAAAALAVGATDGRGSVPEARVVLRAGLDVFFDRNVPLLGPAAVRRPRTLQPVAPPAGTSAAAFLGRKPSPAAGKVVLLPTGSTPRGLSLAASSAGAAAVLLYGGALPPGSLGVADDPSAIVVQIPTADAQQLLAAQRAGVDVGVSIGPARAGPNADGGRVASFSSTGLAFDGSVKPDVVAPGVAIATSEPGPASRGPLYDTVNGTSVAAATVGGAAALLAQLRPSLDAAALRSLLVGYSASGGSPLASGAGVFRLGAAAVGEVATEPATLGFGIWGGPHWHATRTLVLRNVSSRLLSLSVDVVADGSAGSLAFKVEPAKVAIRPGRARTVRITVTAPEAPGGQVVTGTVRIAAPGSETLHVPWALRFDSYEGSLLSHVSLDRTSFAPSDTDPALLQIQAGNVVTDGGLEVEPVARLDILLYTAGGRFVGVLARLRDLLPGAYTFGITGRGPSSVRLPAGRYELRLAAWPTLPRAAPPSRAQVGFTIQ